MKKDVITTPITKSGAPFASSGVTRTALASPLALKTHVPKKQTVKGNLSNRMWLQISHSHLTY